jgi:hypothetical protein
MATMTAQGTLPSAGGDMTAAPVTNTINHVMNTYNGNNIDENNVDYTNSDGVMVLAQAQTRTAALTQKATFTVGVDDTGHDVQFFGATTGKSFLWDESADKLIITGDMSVSGTMTYTSATQFSNTVTVGVDDTGYDVKFFGATTAKSMLWDESADTLIIAGKQTISETLLVTGVGTFTAQSIHNGGLSTGAMVINDGSITDSSGAITFGNENLVTTGTLGAGVATLATGSTVGNLTLANGSITDSSGSITFVNENLVTTGTLGAGASTLGATTATTMDGVIGSVTPAAGTFTTLTANTSITGTLATAAQGNITSLGTIGSLVATTADINAGTVDAVIGGTTPAAGTFTTLAGTTSVVAASDITITSGSILSASGAITFGNENLTTTGTLGSGTFTVSSDMIISTGSITSASGAITFVNENLVTTGTLGAGATTVTTFASSGIDDNSDVGAFSFVIDATTGLPHLDSGTGADGVATTYLGKSATRGATLICDDDIAVIFDANNNGTNYFAIGENATTRGGMTELFRVAGGGSVFIGDTTNTKMVVGLTINQGANDDEIFALKSSDVAHGVTGFTETDTYAYLSKNNATEGGLLIQALTEGAVGLQPTALVTTENSTRTTSGTGAIYFNTQLKSGTSNAALSADVNLVVISNNGTTRFIFDSDGDSHQDVGTAWTNFDDEPDALITRSLGLVMDKASIVKTKWDDWGRNHKEDLIRTGVMPRLTAEQEANGERALVNTTQVMRLHNGALWQLYTQIMDMAERIEDNVPALRGKLIPQLGA